MKKEEIKSFNKKLDIVICPKCKEELGVYCVIKASPSVYLDKNDTLQYDDIFESLYPEGFYCQECGELLTKSNDTIRLIIKGEFDMNKE